MNQEVNDALAENNALWRLRVDHRDRTIFELGERIKALETALRDINALVEGPVHTLRFLARKALGESA